MNHYQLRCSADHRFDGWFRDSAGFETQARHRLVVCPDCGDTTVSRALMAPSIGKSRAEPAAADPAPAPPPPEKTGVVLPDGVRAALQKLRAEVEQNCDYVGPGFADEARRIHRGESGKRGIYGESTPEQAEALADEGIEVSRIPWVPRADG